MSNKLDPERPLLCRTCKELKPITEFVHSTTYTRANAHCKECLRKHKKYRVLNEPGFKEEQSRFKRERKRNIKQDAINRLGGKCNSCGLVDHQSVYDFHHLNPSEKERGVSTMVQYTKAKFELELSKCILLCANCHRKLHHDKSFS